MPSRAFETSWRLFFVIFTPTRFQSRNESLTRCSLTNRYELLAASNFYSSNAYTHSPNFLQTTFDLLRSSNVLSFCCFHSFQRSSNVFFLQLKSCRTHGLFNHGCLIFSYFVSSCQKLKTGGPTFPKTLRRESSTIWLFWLCKTYWCILLVVVLWSVEF